MKQPKTDGGKISFPGMLKVLRSEDGVLRIYPRQPDEKDPKNELKVVYNKGPVPGHTWDNFTSVRERLNDQWAKCPKKADVVSEGLKKRVTFFDLLAFFFVASSFYFAFLRVPD